MLARPWRPRHVNGSTGTTSVVHSSSWRAYASAVGVTVAAEHSADGPAPATLDASTSAADSEKPTCLRILIVDDDPTLLHSLKEILESDGHSIVTADGGQAGIDTFLASMHTGDPFPVVITDLGMPYVDGRKVATAVKTVNASTVVLMLTGWGQRLAAANDVPAHVDKVLNKPPKLTDLREALARIRPVTH